MMTKSEFILGVSDKSEQLTFHLHIYLETLSNLKALTVYYVTLTERHLSTD